MAAELRWKRSSYSGSANSSCVECAVGGNAMWVRDSKDRGGRQLKASSAGWRAFVAFVRA